MWGAGQCERVLWGEKQARTKWRGAGGEGPAGGRSGSPGMGHWKVSRRMAVRTGSGVTGSWGTFPVKPGGSCLMRAECLEGLMAMGGELTRAHRNVTTKDQAAHEAGHTVTEAAALAA